MSPDDPLREISLARELLEIRILDVCLDALVDALRLEHGDGLFFDLPATNDPATLRAARALLRRTRELHRAIGSYRRAVADAVVTAAEEDLPF